MAVLWDREDGNILCLRILHCWMAVLFCTLVSNIMELDEDDKLSTCWKVSCLIWLASLWILKFLADTFSLSSNDNSSFSSFRCSARAVTLCSDTSTFGLLGFVKAATVPIVSVLCLASLSRQILCLSLCTLCTQPLRTWPVESV